MYDRDAVQAINIDQIVTPTDRMLLGGMPKHRPLARVPAYDAVPQRLVLVRQSRHRRVVVAALVAAYASLAITVVCLRV